MFNWIVSDDQLIVKLPFIIYWGVTGSVTIILAIGLSFMSNPGWVCKIVDTVPLVKLKGYLKNTEMYHACKGSSDEKKKKKRGEEELKRRVRSGAVVHNGDTTTDSASSGESIV
jgi:hypothetical protein